MATIKLPQAGNSTGATVRKWRLKPGDQVRKGDTLLEIEIDEGLAIVDSPVEGTLSQILAAEGRTVPTGTALAVIGQQAPSTQPPTQEAHPMATEQPISRGNVTPIVMPKAGQSMEEGTLVKWHVQPGAIIQKGQVIFEIETDKATMDVEATDAGRLAKIVVREGDVVPVMTPVAYLADNDADVEALLQQGPGDRDQGSARSDQGEKAEQIPVQRQQDEPGRVKASPAARKVAGERGIDLATVGLGSGPGGRILSTDVPLKAPPPPPAPAPVPTQTPATGGGRRRMSKMRKAIADNLSLSKRTIPHFYIRATINVEPMLSFYQAEKAKYPCSINDVVVMACARAIRELPQFRSRIEGDEIVQFDAVNIGIAVGMDDGLVVPVVTNADQLTLMQLGAESKRIAAAARAGKIEGLGKGLFTITNMGMLGVEEFAAIVNPPEVAILAVGAAREAVIVSGGTLRAGKVMTLTLSVDHRVIDGMLAARFMARLKQLLEWPAQMM